MMETLVALAFAHLMADFVLQTDGMVRRKREPRVLLGHVAVVAGASWFALGLPPTPALVGFVAASHLLIDAAKLRWGGGGFRGFMLDQAAHFGAVLLAAALAPGAFAAGMWDEPLSAARLPEPAHLPEAMALGAGLIATVWAGGHAVAALMTDVPVPPNPDSLPRGGRLIGKLERLVILMLVLADEPAGIGFLIAAKSILRFTEISGADDRHVSEYVIIGTLASFSWAIATGYVTRAALQALAP